MASLEQQEKVVFLNSQYQDNSELISRMQETLLKDIVLMKLSIDELNDTKEYLKDKVTIFRFLRECKFDFEQAHARLLDTILWRIEYKVDHLTFEDAIEFFDQNGFVFFHGTDNTASHPLVFVQLRYFPKQFKEKKSLTEHIRPFACLIMEMARKLTWEMTCDRINRGEPCALVSRMTVLVNVSKAPLIPIDAELIKTMGVILDERFPGFVNNINVLNFGWMYQGVWSLLKHLLSEEAKESIRFTTIRELQPIISEDRILKDMGGTDDYVWTMGSDQVLQKYGCGYEKRRQEAELLPNTPPLSLGEEGIRSRSNSVISSSDEYDEFFDANDVLLPSPQPVPSIPPPTMHELPPLIAPIRSDIIPQPSISSPLKSPITTLTSSATLPGTSLHNSNSYYGNLSSWAGLRMGVNFLTSFIDTKQQRPPNKSTGGLHALEETDSSSVIVVEPAAPDTVNSNSLPPAIAAGTRETGTISHSTGPTFALASSTQRMQQIQLFFKRLTHQLLQLSFGPNKGIVYWVVLYLFLRGPVETLVKKSLLRSTLVGPKKLSTTTIGITAAIAAVVSTSVSSTLERFRR
ncbi:hypothetical protein HMPREF1544_00002 [Mucor circinelloides 1006PhL]|uniref:CRAL-TRIO domain-containing protein n=1 Tax=Mucor circinelloides f. circinelloides (strain 1006PhL) TaxID=1220926 RepID=S2KBT4_MUCC1|nr:hypothetical protein HMPREF1544_00002 [Mucor circinelloides 1006PhL]